MAFTEYLLIKAGVLLVLAFAYGLYRGFNDSRLRRLGRSDRTGPAAPDR